MARVLSGAWRRNPPPLEITAGEWREAEPILLGTGAGGLAWARVRGTPLERALGAGVLREAYRYQTVTVLARGSRIADVMERLRAAGVEAVVGKGWAAARLYPEPGRRPAGDIDVYVRRRDHAAAAALLRGRAGELVDLHGGFADLDDREEDEIFARSRLIGEGPDAVRVFGSEDHLRLIVLHALRHGVLRPLWLCDVACAVESVPDGFDWDWFASGRRRRTDWALVGLEIARAVLGADLAAVPEPRRPSLAGWVVPTVLEEWGAARAPHGARSPIDHLLHRPAALARGLRERWPNGIEATVNAGRSFGRWPRLGAQVAECVRRAALFAARKLRARGAGPNDPGYNPAG